jgi:hypothetical protein
MALLSEVEGLRMQEAGLIELPALRIYFKNHGKYKIYRNILTESQIKRTLSHLEHPRLTG